MSGRYRPRGNVTRPFAADQDESRTVRTSRMTPLTDVAGSTSR
jgi:hypothetical protein